MNALFKKYSAAFFAWLSQPMAQEATSDPSRLTEALLPVSQLYGFEANWLRTRRYSEK